jgi:L-fuconolactonase
VIDAYCHCGISRYLPVADVLAAMDHSGVQRTVLVQHKGEYDNSYLAGAVRDYHERFTAVGLIDAESPDWRRALDGLTQSGEFKGLRVSADVLMHRADVCQAALAQGLIIMVGTGSGITECIPAIRRLLRRAAGGTIVITHLGSPRVEDNRMITGRELLELSEEQGVCVTLSGQSMFCDYPYAPLDDFTREVIEAFGPDRLMWGSNFPESGDASAYRENLALVTGGAWGLRPADIEKIVHTAAERLWFT